MIYIECNPDFMLVQAITNLPKREIVHGKNKGEICNKLERQRNGKGLIDEDPDSIQPRYLQKLTTEGDVSELDIRLLHDNSSDNYLIVLCPTLEGWILKAAKASGIDVRKYGLPNEHRKLHGEINIALDKFEKLLDDLKRSSRLQALKKLIEKD